MNRRQAADVERWAAEDAAGNPKCLLCGQGTFVFVDPDDEDGLAVFDLCGRCNSAFSGLARALEAAQEARSRRVEAVAQMAGRLELDDAPVCTCGVEVLGLSGHTPGCALAPVRTCLCGHLETAHAVPVDDVLVVCSACECELFEFEVEA